MNAHAEPHELAGARAARDAARRGSTAPTAGLAHGMVQTNLIAVPRDWAYDVLLFAQRNPAPVPVLDVTEPGDPTTRLAPGADLRTDLPEYRVWRDGELTDEPADATEAWAEHDDLVAFLIGCSFTFEGALQDEGIPVRHIAEGRNVPMYRTRIACEPAGRLRGELVVSMRPIAADRVVDAVRITGRYPSVHGAPVHLGDPAAIGIDDLDAPTFGDAVTVHDGEVPVFWACGVTPQAAIMASRPPFAITHAPGKMFVTDVPDRAYLR